MEMFARIAVGLDLGAERASLSTGSREAAARARRLASLAGSEVFLVHSLAADEYWVDDERGFVWVDEGSKPEGQQQLEELCREFRAAGIRTELVTTERRAEEALGELVSERAVDLVVTGTRSEISSDGRALGSTAMQLIHHCPCDVWAVKPDPPGESRCILLATDLSPVGERVLHAGARLSQLVSDPELHVVHAYQIPLSVQMEGEDSRSDFERREHASARNRIESILQEAEAAGEPALHVGVTSPTAAILEVAERIGPDLCVMGSVSRHGLPGLLMGNTAERLLGRLESSLLVVKI